MTTMLAIVSVLTLSLADFVAANDFVATNAETPTAIQLAQRLVIDEQNLTVVVYDSGSADHYDLRGISLYVDAILDAFPIQDYPDIKSLVDAYDTARSSPTRQNGETLEQAFAQFADNLPGSETERIQEASMQAMTVGMLRVQRETMTHLAAGLKQAFNTADHAKLVDFYGKLDAFSSNPTDEDAAEDAQAAFADFVSSLTAADQTLLETIEQQASQKLTESYAGGMVQTMIAGWVANIKDSRQFLRGDLGDLISPDAFGKLEGEMSYERVHAIIGREGDRQMSSNSNVDGVVTTSAQYMWSWQISPGTLARIHASFLNDELRVKAYDEVTD